MGIAALLLASQAVGSQATVKPEAAEANGETEKVESVPDDVRLISGLGPEVKESLARVARGIVVWPSADDFKSKKPSEDRSQTTEEKMAVAMTPKAGLEESTKWIGTILKAKWIPSDLGSRLQALAEKDPARSSVWCRYKMNGQTIQIGQWRWVMGVVIRPDKPKGKDETAEAFGRRCLKEFMASGELLAKNTTKAETPAPPGLTMFSGFFQTHDAFKEWGGMVTWYTDGQAVAVIIQKNSGQMAIASDTPWF